MFHLLIREHKIELCFRVNKRVNAGERERESCGISESFFIIEQSYRVQCTNKTKLNQPIAMLEKFTAARISSASESLGMHSATSCKEALSGEGLCTLKSFHLIYNSHFIISWPLTKATMATLKKKRSKHKHKMNNCKFCCRRCRASQNTRHVIAFTSVNCTYFIVSHAD